MILVVAPNEAVFDLFAAAYPNPEYRFVRDVRDITECVHWVKIILVNGGSHDAHIRNLCNHPSRQGIIERREV